MATSCGTVTVLPAFDAGAVTIENCTVSDSQVTTGGSVTVTATVANGNDADARVRVTLSVGQQTNATDVTISAGQTRSVSSSFAMSQAGEYPAEVTISDIARA